MKKKELRKYWLTYLKAIYILVDFSCTNMNPPSGPIISILLHSSNFLHISPYVTSYLCLGLPRGRLHSACSCKSYFTLYSSPLLSMWPALYMLPHLIYLHYCIYHKYPYYIYFSTHPVHMQVHKFFSVLCLQTLSIFFLLCSAFIFQTHRKWNTINNILLWGPIE